MGVAAFMDESGKFRDKDVISLGCVAAMQDQFKPFSHDWWSLLKKNGIKEFHAKKLLNPAQALSEKNPDVGLDNRIRDLLPFIGCIRKHLQVVTGIAVDVRAFQNLPQHFYRYYGKNPALMSFASVLMHVLNFVPSRDKIVVTFDEDEETALPLYDIYKRIKRKWPKAKEHLAAISFADDEALYGLQAADLIASIVRLEFDWKWNKAEYDYSALWGEITREIDITEGRLWYVGISMGDKEALSNLASDLKVEWDKLKHE